MTFAGAEIQLCAYDVDGAGLDALPEVLKWYPTPKAGRDAARLLLASNLAVTAVWVRKIRDGKMRTVAMVTREKETA